jgi:hypothetical protein
VVARPVEAVGMDMMWGMWGMMGGMIVPWLLLIAAIVVGVWWLVGPRAPRHDRALESDRLHSVMGRTWSTALVQCGREDGQRVDTR